MSAAIHNHVVAEASTSTFDNIKNGALNAVNWMGRQIVWLANTVKQYAIRVFEWAKPFFQSLGKMFAEMYDKVKELVMKNKEASIAVGIAIPVITALAIGAYLLCIKDKNEEGAEKQAPKA